MVLIALALGAPETSIGKPPMLEADAPDMKLYVSISALSA